MEDNKLLDKMSSTGEATIIKGGKKISREEALKKLGYPAESVDPNLLVEQLEAKKLNNTGDEE